jgi:hypothetical protein
MRKFTHLDSLDRPRQPKSKAPLVLAFAFVVLATPPAFELAKINLARFGVFGLSRPVDTPVLDFVSAQWEATRSELRDWSTPLFVNRRWNPQLVIPFAFVWTALAALMLRRGH